VEILLVLEIKTVKVSTYITSEVCLYDEELCHEDRVGGEVWLYASLTLVLDGRVLPSSFSDHFAGGESTTSMSVIQRWLSIRAGVDTVEEKLICLLHQFDPSLSL
jgi:hypothetical protein